MSPGFQARHRISDGRPLCEERNLSGFTAAAAGGERQEESVCCQLAPEAAPVICCQEGHDRRPVG